MVIKELPEGRLDLSTSCVWYIKGSRNVVLVNASGTISHEIRNPQQCSVSRLRSGNYLVKEVRVQDAKKDAYIDLSPSYGKRILALELGNQEVFNIKLSSMIGFSHGLTMSSSADIGLPSLILKKVLFQSITGPGMCLVELSGRPTWACGETQQISFQTDRLIAWSNDVEFELKCGKRRMDLYLDSFYLSTVCKSAGQSVLLDSDREDATPTRSLIRFIRGVLSPI